MARNRTHRALRVPRSSPLTRLDDHRRDAVLSLTVLLVITTIVSAIEVEWNRLFPEPYHTSVLSGHSWVQELLNGHRDRMKDNIGARPHVFRVLERELINRGGLRPRRWVDTTEMLAIFLYQAVTNNSVRQTAERFQRSNETVSNCFHDVLNAINSPGFRSAYMRLPDDKTPARIALDPKLSPFLKDCRGAIDGSHMPVNPPSITRGRWRDREGNLTQNVLAICDFDMFFVWVMTGAEGSAADSALYAHAVNRGGLGLPEGKYWLGDAGFASCDTLLVPYRNVRYHLREWQIGNRRPQNAEELFNLRHAQARNIIERMFGVLKKEFKMACEPSDYSIRTQCLIPSALMLLHNFFRIYDPERHSDELRISTQDELAHAVDPHGDNAPVATTAAAASEDARASARRDQIAQAMWRQYQETLARRREHRT
ncbi:unnamed protein product [Peniophora sp. CBMAI 1063]|nr:unnamed protein product [Peniophora sp. CBMAI 1063]